jgi:hypothetical protein
MHEARLPLLRAILAFSIISTAAHYAHNFVAIEDYPQSDLVSNGVVQVAIIVSWPLLTAIGLMGFRLYAQGRYRRARAFLVTYSLTGLLTLGHFIDGDPDIPAFFYATIFTDALAGLAILAFTAWSSAAATSG